MHDLNGHRAAESIVIKTNRFNTTTSSDQISFTTFDFCAYFTSVIWWCMYACVYYYDSWAFKYDVTSRDVTYFFFCCWLISLLLLRSDSCNIVMSFHRIFFLRNTQKYITDEWARISTPQNIWILKKRMSEKIAWMMAVCPV